MQFYFVDELVHFVFSFTLHLYYVAQGAVLVSHLNPFDDVGWLNGAIDQLIVDSSELLGRVVELLAIFDLGLL